MKSLIKLLWANTKLRPARTALTALAVIASSCVVVWVVSGYDALIGQSIDENAAQAIGRFDLVVSGGGGGPGGDGPPSKAASGRRPGATDESRDGTKKSEGSGPEAAATKSARRGGSGRPARGSGPGGPPLGLPEGVIATLKGDEQVAEANLTTQSRVSVGRAAPLPGETAVAKLLRSDRPPVNGMPPLAPPLIGTDAAEPPHEMASGRWIDPAAAERAEGVLSASYAKTLQAEPGDDLKVNSEVGEWTVKLVGIVEQPQFGGGGRGGATGSQAGLFVSLPFAEVINGHPARIGQVNLVLKDGVDPGAYGKALAERIAAMKAAATITDILAIKEGMAQGLSQTGSKALAYSATGIALMAALFIIFTTLSMGVSERARELAVLRAVGMTRGQVASLVFLEGLVLALLGWAGGLIAGWGLLTVVSRAKPDLFTDGAALGPWCVALTAVASLGGALAAAVLPAWRATRVSPLDAMAPPRLAGPSRWVVPAALAGLALLAINPLLTYVLPLADATRTWAYALVGYPGMVLGFVLLAPWVIVVFEKYAGPWVARLLGLPPRLLASIFSANLWRTLGTTVALTVGLGLYIATQTWGYSMLGPFTPGDWVPEMLVGFEPSGLPNDQIDAVKHVKGVIPERCMPLAVEQPRLVKEMTGGSSSVVRQDNVVLIGLDPLVAFGGDDPMIDATFAAGDRATAAEKLKAGGACIVPDHFLESSGLGLGGKLEMAPPDGPPGKVVAYEIVGAVSLPGWHWMTKMTGLRRRATRAGAMVFAPIADVRRDFNVERTNFFWLDTDGSVTSQQVEADMQAIAEAHGESKFRVAGVGEVTSRRPYARLTSAEAVRSGIRARADGLIWGMSQIPLVTLLITSLAVVNTVVSSVRARRWDLGVLRALGTTRGGLMRLIFAESLMIGLVVCALGMAFGVMAGWCGAGMARYLSPFGGMSTPLVLPWSQLALGISTALGLCLLAALWPAFTTGRAEPLRLLQSGRGAT